MILVAQRLFTLVFPCSCRPKVLAKYSGLVQCAVAAVSALESPHAAHWERILSVEKARMWCYVLPLLNFLVSVCLFAGSAAQSW